MPQAAPANDVFRPLAFQATRRDRLTVRAMLLLSLLLTLGVAAVSHTMVLDLPSGEAEPSSAS